jgi:hypothetical protein
MRRLWIERPSLDSLRDMAIVSGQPDSSAQAGAAGMSLQTDQAKAIVEEIRAEDAA